MLFVVFIHSKETSKHRYMWNKCFHVIRSCLRFYKHKAVSPKYENEMERKGEAETHANIRSM